MSLISVGQKFSYLTVIGRARIRSKLCWRVKCECGKEKTVQPSQLVGHPRPIKSCGCKRITLLRQASLIHGCSTKSDSAQYKTFIAWQAMLWRCYNKQRSDYPSYGGRGIKVCRRWITSFPNFLADMGLRPIGLSLGRKDNDKGYSPANCEWQTARQQARNKRSNMILKLGNSRLILADWAEKTGIGRHTIAWRVKKGWSVADALFTPVRGAQ